MIFYWHILRAQLTSRRILTRYERGEFALDLSRTPDPHNPSKGKT